MKDEVKLSLELANIIIGYLGKRPYEEVYQIIQRMEAEHKANRDAGAMQQVFEEAPKEAES
jgi:hypothetical protein